VRSTLKATRLRALVPQDSAIETVHFDLLDHQSIKTVMVNRRPQFVVHCAAYGVDYQQQDLEVAIRSNVSAAGLLVELASEVGVMRFVHIGTCYEYGDHSGPIREDAALRPRGVYGTTKAAGTLIALDRAATMGLSLVVVRPFGMYGPMEGGHKFVPLVVQACRQGAPLKLTRGEQVRDYVYVGDVAEGIVQLIERDVFPSGEILNFASERGITIRELGECIVTAVGRGSEFLRWGEKPYRGDELMSVVGQGGKARQFGWRSSTSLEQGLRETVRATDGEGGWE